MIDPVRIRFGRGFSLTPSRALVLSFVFLIMVATAVMYHPDSTVGNRSMDLVDALFMAVSAVCVTGLTTVNVADGLSYFGQGMLLFFVQLGGLGVVLFSSSLLLMMGGKLGLGGRKMIQEFLPGISLTGVVRLTRYIVLVVFVIELVGAIFLAMAWVPEFGWRLGCYHALFHSVTSVCGAGFSSFSNGLIEWRGNYLVNYTVMALIVLGGLGFLATTDIVALLFGEKSRRRLSLHTYIVLLFSGILIVVGAFGVALFESDNPQIVSGVGLFKSLMICLFQSITCRSCGFSTVEIGSLHEETQQLLIVLMFIGGAPGSTAGGIKVTTFSLLTMATIAQLCSRQDIEIGGRRIAWERIQQSLALTITAIITVIVVTIVLNICESEAYSHLLLEAVSALGTVGLSTGCTTELGTVSKLVLCVSMFIGRVGPLTLAASLISGPSRKHTRLPLGEVTIG